jgi:hypothetical protein
VTAGTQSVARLTDNRGLVLLARVGLVGYGIVHLLIAWLAAQVALDGGGAAEAGKGGALHEIASRSWGAVLLWVIAVGLFALALWQLGEAMWGRKAHSGARRRIPHVVEALVLAFLGWSAAKVAAGGKSQSNAEQAGLTQQLLDAPAGQVLLAVAGLAVVGAAAYLIHKGWTERFVRDLDFSAASPSTRRGTVRLGKVGHVAQGIAYGIVGALVVVAAIQHDPDKATGLDTALATLAAQPYGTLLLLLVALGLACFGVYCFLDARFRRP